MAQLEWSEALNLDLPLMDDTHREFVDLLAAVDQADDAGLLPRWRALVEHAEQHFGQEDDWMASTRFATGCFAAPACSTAERSKSCMSFSACPPVAEEICCSSGLPALGLRPRTSV